MYITIDNGSNNTVGGSCYPAHRAVRRFVVREPCIYTYLSNVSFSIVQPHIYVLYASVYMNVALPISMPCFYFSFNSSFKVQVCKLSSLHKNNLYKRWHKYSCRQLVFIKLLPRRFIGQSRYPVFLFFYLIYKHINLFNSNQRLLYKWNAHGRWIWKYTVQN